MHQSTKVRSRTWRGRSKEACSRPASHLRSGSSVERQTMQERTEDVAGAIGSALGWLVVGLVMIFCALAMIGLILWMVSMIYYLLTGHLWFPFEGHPPQ